MMDKKDLLIGQMFSFLREQYSFNTSLTYQMALLADKVGAREDSELVLAINDGLQELQHQKRSLENMASLSRAIYAPSSGDTNG